jgi:hypothetical protein
MPQDTEVALEAIPGITGIVRAAIATIGPSCLEEAAINVQTTGVKTIPVIEPPSPSKFTSHWVQDGGTIGDCKPRARNCAA